MSGIESDRTEQSSPLSQAAPPERDVSRSGGPLWYVRLAVRIARVDADAMAQASQDTKAIFYGAGFLAVGVLAAYLLEWLVSGPPPGDGSIPDWVLFVVEILVVIPLQILFSAVSIGVIHGAAKVLFGATGRYVALLRVLWLGSVVQWLNVIPFVGGLVAGAWFLLITLVTFEEVDGVERLQALALVVALGALMLLARVTWAG